MFTEHCLETLLERMKMFRYLVGDEAEQVIFGRGSCVCTRSRQLYICIFVYLYIYIFVCILVYL